MIERMTFDRFIEEEDRRDGRDGRHVCRDNALPIQVFKLMEPGNVQRVVLGEAIGTVVAR